MSTVGRTCTYEGCSRLMAFLCVSLVVAVRQALLHHPAPAGVCRCMHRMWSRIMLT